MTIPETLIRAQKAAHNLVSALTNHVVHCYEQQHETCAEPETARYWGEQVDKTNDQLQAAMDLRDRLGEMAMETANA
jgi:hypothetical protein